MLRVVRRALYRVIEVSVKGKAANNVPTGKLLVNQLIDATTTAAVIGLTDGGTHS